MAARRSSEHHCGPFGPNCTAKVGLSTASRDRLDARDLLLDARAAGRGRSLRPWRGRRPAAPPGGRRVAIDQRIAVAHEDGEGHPHADVARRAGDFARLLDRRHRPVEAGVVRHDRARAAARRAAEGGERAEIGVDRRHRREPQQPGLERLAAAPNEVGESGRAMIMRVDQRRQGEAAPLGRRRRRRDRRDRAVLDDEVDRRPRPAAPSVGRSADAGQIVVLMAGSSITLMWAATIRQPSGKRTQVCICRPTLPGAPSRRNSVAAMARSRP